MKSQHMVGLHSCFLISMRTCAHYEPSSRQLSLSFPRLSSLAVALTGRCHLTAAGTQLLSLLMRTNLPSDRPRPIHIHTAPLSPDDSPRYVDIHTFKHTCLSRSPPLQVCLPCASNPSLRCLPSADQRCKKPSPYLYRSGSRPLPPFCLIENMYSRKDPREGPVKSVQRDTESREGDWRRQEVNEEEGLCGRLMCVHRAGRAGANGRRVSWCGVSAAALLPHLAVNVIKRMLIRGSSTGYSPQHHLPSLTTQ